MKIKVLKLENWMYKYPNNFPIDYLYEIQPYFNRDGYYLANGVCWFECSGKAYFTDRNDFKYSLFMLNIPLYRDCEYEAMDILIDGKISSVKMEREVFAHKQAVSLHKMMRRIRMKRNRALRK